MLTALLKGHRGRLIADLRRFYGLSLMQARGSIPLRELAALAAHLPAEAAVWQPLHPDASVTADQLLLQAVEFRLQQLVWLQTKDAQSASPRNRPEHPYPVTADEIAAHLARQKAAEPDRPDRMSLDDLRARLPMGRPATT